MNIKPGVCGLFLCMFISLLCAQWETAQHLNENGTACPANIGIVASSLDSVVHMVWSGIREGRPTIYYRRSTDFGQTWENETPLVEAKGNAENPAIAIAGGINEVVHVMWDDDRDGDKEIYYKRSSDSGITWSGDIRITDAQGTSVKPNLHGCICSSEDLRMVWVDERNGNPDIYYKYSNDNGITWSDDIRITKDGFVQDNPALSCCGADVQVVWIDHKSSKPEVRGRFSTDCGATWFSDMLLSKQEHICDGFPLVIQADSTYHLLWTAHVDISDPPRYSIFYRKTDNLGLSWNPVKRIATHETVYLPLISCAAEKENIHLVWGIPGQGLFYKRSTNNGFTWEQTACLKDEISVWNPGIALSDKCVHIVWYEKNGKTADIYYMRNPTGNPVDPP